MYVYGVYKLGGYEFSVLDIDRYQIDHRCCM